MSAAERRKLKKGANFNNADLTPVAEELYSAIVPEEENDCDNKKVESKIKSDKSQPLKVPPKRLTVFRHVLFFNILRKLSKKS